MSNTQAQELKREQLCKLFHFAIIQFWTAKVPRAVTISESRKENVAPAASSTRQM